MLKSVLKSIPFLFILAFSLLVGGCDSSDDPEVTIEDLVVGTGEEVQVGDEVRVKYRGWLKNGTEFDSGETKLWIKTGQVIEGWVQGIPGMKVGGKRRLTIPPELGYGKYDYFDIPGNSTLFFDVEMLGITTQATTD